MKRHAYGTHQRWGPLCIGIFAALAAASLCPAQAPDVPDIQFSKAPDGQLNTLSLQPVLWAKSLQLFALAEELAKLEAISDDNSELGAAVAEQVDLLEIQAAIGHCIGSVVGEAHVRVRG